MKKQEFNPVDHLVQVFYKKGGDLSDPEVASAITQAMNELGHCRDTMAILVKGLGLGGDESYREIRNNFGYRR